MISRVGRGRGHGDGLGASVRPGEFRTRMGISLRRPTCTTPNSNNGSPENADPSTTWFSAVMSLGVVLFVLPPVGLVALLVSSLVPVGRGRLGNPDWAAARHPEKRRARPRKQHTTKPEVHDRPPGLNATRMSGASRITSATPVSRVQLWGSKKYLSPLRAGQDYGSDLGEGGRHPAGIEDNPTFHLQGEVRNAEAVRARLRQTNRPR